MEGEDRPTAMTTCVGCGHETAELPRLVCSACLDQNDRHMDAMLADEQAKQADPERTRRAVLGWPEEH